MEKTKRIRLTDLYSIEDIEYFTIDSLQPQVCPKCGFEGDHLEPDAIGICEECGAKTYSISEWILRGLPF